MTRVMLTGNEAIARGAWEAGVHFATGYPGTPSTEILETIAALYKKDVYCYWACNEKVAMEMASGASIGGLRSLVTMKHVGLNVAADPLFTMGYIGVNGGLVVVSADDPGCHSSQNEQDNRLYAQAAKIALIEPSDSQECKDFLILAYDLSERFDIPVLYRITTRVAHSRSPVETGSRRDCPVRPYVRQPGKNAMLPAAARKRHADRERSLQLLEEYSNECSDLNRIEWGSDRRIGVITSGVSYHHAREAFGNDVSYLKLGLTNPIPRKLVSSFAQSVRDLYVIEEGEPFIESKVRAMGFKCRGKDVLPLVGEIDSRMIREAFGVANCPESNSWEIQVPERPPVLCAGCPHRGFFYALGRRRSKVVAVGDIGCYGLGIQFPFEGFDISICMGAGLSAAVGLARALSLQGDKRKVFGIVGDSTFFHSGINSFIDAVHSRANICACVLDNRTTAMTGHQDNAGTSTDLMGDPVPAIDIANVVYATGVDPGRVRVVDPLDLSEMQRAIDDAIQCDGIFVIITKRPCAMLETAARARPKGHYKVDQDKCRMCKACLGLACPAIAVTANGICIDPAGCNGCGVCVQVCKFGAISKAGE